MTSSLGQISMHVLKYPEDLQSHPFASPEKSALSLTKNQLISVFQIFISLIFFTAQWPSKQSN